MGLGRKRLSMFIVGLTLLWPPIHIVMTKYFHSSTWRLFGWGMYATPNPESQSRLRVIIFDQDVQTPPDLTQLHFKLTKVSSNPEQESLCINMFKLESGGELVKVPRRGLCKDAFAARNLDYFLHFGRSKHLSLFVNAALRDIRPQPKEAIVFLTHQRIDLFLKRAYTESDVYTVKGKNTHYLGVVKNGWMHL